MMSVCDTWAMPKVCDLSCVMLDLEEAGPTFHFWHEAEALLEVWADAVEAPAKLGVAAVLVGAAGVVTSV